MFGWLFKTGSCQHEYQEQLECVGATVDWALQPTRCFEQYEKCMKCGKIRKRKKGVILFGDRESNPDKYESEFPYWPIDEDGNRLPSVY